MKLLSPKTKRTPKMKKLGIIGGMGPMATAHFLTLLTQMTKATKDQDHIEIILRSRPSIPDRSDFITGKSPLSPEKDLIELSKNLQNTGAQILAIPCFTSYYFYETIKKEIKIPILHPIKETAKHLKESNIKTVGLLATTGTILSQIYQDTLKQSEITTILPTQEDQKTLMDIIYKNLKTGQNVSTAKIENISKTLTNQKAEIIILGCSELSLIRKTNTLATTYLDTLEILARSSVLRCGKLRDEYTNLLKR